MNCAFNVSSKSIYILIFSTVSVFFILFNDFDQRKEIVNHMIIDNNNNNYSNIFCFVFLFSEKSLVTDNNSWTSECDGWIFVTANETLSNIYPLKTIFVDIPISSNLSEILWHKTVASVNYSYRIRSEEFEWFLISADDIFVKIAELRYFLNRFNSSERHYFGYSWPGLLRTGHVGGFVLSNPSISWLLEDGLFNKKLCSENYSGSEQIRSCLQKVDVFSGIDPDFQSLFIPRETLSNSKPKLILGWNTILKGDNGDLTTSISENCSFRCVLSFDHSLVKQADAIVFNFHDSRIEGLKKLPAVRYPWQRYVFMEMESNANDQTIPNIAIKSFNWSMTYRRDSDVLIDYGMLLRHTQSDTNQEFVKQTTLKKSKMVAWLVSNCHTPSKREDYVKELRQYVAIDQFGCGGKVNFSYSCPRDSTSYGHWCRGIPFTTDYRFYLSFENSVCPDYVTEKFYQALDHLMVPIVLRKADYLDIAPPGSYIAADQFKSPKHLATYLHFLANNPNEYFKYFDYTKTSKVVWNWNQMVKEGLCRLCRLLQENRTETVGTDMRAKWVKDKISCVQGFAKNLL